MPAKKKSTNKNAIKQPKKADSKKNITKTVTKNNSKKTTAKKTVTKKTKPAIKKTTTKKTVAKKTTAKKTVAKKTVAKKTVAKKTAEKKANETNFKRPANLAKKILSKTTQKKSEETVETPVEKQQDLLQKIIIARRPQNKNKVNFKVGDFAVYPSHGVGKIIEIEKSTVLGQDFSCYLMSFEREKLTIKVPTSSAEKIGLRHLITKSQMDEVFSILRSGVKKLKGMWSRRAQEYETKINSGDIILLAEVLRDLTRDIEDSERSYSERIIYETAIYRLAGEYSAIYGVDLEEAKEKVTLTAKDKLNSEGKIVQKDDFDDFDDDEFDDEDEEDDDDEYEDEDDDD